MLTLQNLSAKVYTEQEGVDADGFDATNDGTSACQNAKVCSTLVKGKP